MVLLCFLCVDVALNFRWTSAGRSRRCGIACCSGTASSNAPLLYIARQELSLLWVIFAHPEKPYNQINQCHYNKSTRPTNQQQTDNLLFSIYETINHVP